VRCHVDGRNRGDEKTSEDGDLLGCNAVEFEEGLAFRMNISPPYSRTKSKPSKEPGKTDGKASSAGDMFLRNVRLSPNYAVLQPRRPYSSMSPL
jgi:hypothetical protein